jgi:hypothetical protein
MKAERRHELQTNTLAQFLSELPIYLRIHANKILMGVIVICAVVLLVRYRMNVTAEARYRARTELSSARLGVEQFFRLESIPTMDPADKIKQRKTLQQQIQSAIDQALADTSDPEDSAVRAEAFVTQGDLYWTMANLTPIPGAATQPALAMPETPEQYLGRAEMGYQRVVNEYSNQQMAKVTALLGLAAIEENRRNWDEAIEYYNQVTADEKAANVFKGIARQRLSLIPQLRTPVYLGSFSSTQPVTAPATGPTIEPTTEPTTQPGT